MKKLSVIVLLILSVCISFYSCKRKEEMKPDAITTTNGVMRLEAVSCAYTIKATESVVDGSLLNLPAGSVICIESGTRGPLYLKNFVGAPGSPITFINAAGGQTIIKGASGGPWAIKVGYCKNIRITGTGSSSQYGLVIDGGNNGFVLPELTTDWEVDHVEIKNTTFAGMMGKTDPTCDSKTWRNNFTMRNVFIHDNYVHDTGGEAFYIGNSFYNGETTTSCGTVYPHTIEGIRIYKNIINHSGCEGIQVGCADKDCEIYNNTIDSPGQNPFAAYQNNGIQIGAGTCGKCYNNLVKNAPGNGLIMNGIGGNLVYNNVIVNSGALGIFCDERTPPTEGFSFINNTIVNCGTDGIKLYSELVPYNNVINNIIINPKSGKYINTSTGVKLTSHNNYFNMDLASAKLASDYSLLSGSPAINAGADVTSFSILNDFNGSPRPYDNLFDIGAFEYGSPVAGSGSGGTTTTTQSVTSLTLVNADTEKDIATLTNGYVIDFAKIGTKNLNIRANTNPAIVGSVVFGLDANSNFRVENGIPYTLGGDGGVGIYNAWTPALGTHSITATPYSASNLTGTKGTPLSINVTVQNSSVTSTGPSIVSFTLVNADTDKDIATITDGATINLAAIGTTRINIRANTNPAIVGSVLFGLDANNNYHIENSAPYTLAGDGGGNYYPWAPALGSHSITATAFSSPSLAGTKGATVKISFNIINSL